MKPLLYLIVLILLPFKLLAEDIGKPPTATKTEPPAIAPAPPVADIQRGPASQKKKKGKKEKRKKSAPVERPAGADPE